MRTTFGPVLGFRGQRNGLWHVSVLTLQSSNSTARLQYRVGGHVETIDQARPLKSVTGAVLRRYDLTIPQKRRWQRIRYTVNGGTHTFYVPGQEEPLRLAYASCNGFSSRKAYEQVETPNERWRHLGSKHARQPFHLLLMGGDQVYADSVFEAIKTLRDWQELPRRQKLRHPFGQGLRAQVQAHYFFEVYVRRWGQPEVADVLASIPTLMMWDDHDIFDGWGSYAPDLQACPVYQGIYRIASECFRLFQQQCAPAERVPGAIAGRSAFTWAYQVNDVGLLGLDMRSERTQEQVLSPKSWNAVYRRMDQFYGPAGQTGSGNEPDSEARKPCRHFLVLSSIPVVYPNFCTIEKLLGFLPGEQGLEDDLKDQWRSASHLAERKRLVHRLLGFAARARCRVTLLSGDVHVPALGLVESWREEHRDTSAGTINQLISSGIGHPPPPRLVVYMIDKVLGGEREELDRGIEAKLLEFPNTGRRLLPRRNWLSLEFDDTARLWANWWLENEAGPFTKVVHPVR